MKVRNRLKELMKERGIASVLDLSRETELYYGTLLNFYHQRFDVFNAVLIAKLCEYLDCRIEELLVLEEDQAS